MLTVCGEKKKRETGKLEVNQALIQAHVLTENMLTEGERSG